MSKFSEEVRNTFIEILKREEVKDIEITASRFPASIFSKVFWKAMYEKLKSDKTVHVTFHFPVNINKEVFEKIDKALDDVVQFDFDHRGMISYELTPWLNEENNQRTLFSIAGETITGKKVTFALSKDVVEEA